ncbi:MAG: hypothetical protein ACE1Y4_05985, partial [Lysobacterales bacterium]
MATPAVRGHHHGAQPVPPGRQGSSRWSTGRTCGGWCYVVLRNGDKRQVEPFERGLAYAYRDIRKIWP